MTAQEFVNSIRHPIIFYASTYYASGQQFAVLPETSLPDLTVLEGEVEKNCWRWNGEGEPRDSLANSLIKIEIFDDEKRFVREVCEYLTEDGCRDRDAIAKAAAVYGVTAAQVEIELADWFAEAN